MSQTPHQIAYLIHRAVHMYQNLLLDMQIHMLMVNSHHLSEMLCKFLSLILVACRENENILLAVCCTYE